MVESVSSLYRGVVIVARTLERAASKFNRGGFPESAKIDGRMVDLWRAVDAEDKVLDVLVQPKRNRNAALKLIGNTKGHNG
jgi:transposase-like protein